ncbi:host specificity protein J [Escherichia coli]|nr:host specificity protein J [Escherichia coli]
MTRKPWRAGKDLSTVVENMEIGTGQRGDGRHAFVTREELVGLKLARRRTSGGASYALNPGIEIDSTLMTVDFPTKPLNFKATGGFGSVLLEWDMPNYRGHSLTEIWRGTEDNLADAVLVATTPGQVYGDPVDPGWSGFYWIRFVNAAGVKGPWNAEKGTQAQTQIGVKAIIDQIRDEAAKSPVVSELRKEIKNAQGQAVKDAAIKTTEVVGTLREETTRTIGGIETRISTLDSSTSESLNEVDKRITKLDKEGGEAFLAMWSKKAGVDGITAGIGIVAGKDSEGRPVSQVAISASQLFVFDPNNPDNTAYPFAVSGGKVVIPKAMIYDAVIETLVSRKVVADEVKAGVSITSPVIRSAVIQNGNFQVDSQGNLNIGGLFSVTSQGQLTIRYSNQNVGLVIRNDKIEVYDQNGRLAVRIGRLR